MYYLVLTRTVEIPHRTNCFYCTPWYTPPALGTFYVPREKEVLEEKEGPVAHGRKVFSRCGLRQATCHVISTTGGSWLSL